MQIPSLGLNFELHLDFLSSDESTSVFNEFNSSFPLKPNRRLSRTFGDAGLEYVIHWYGKTTVRKAELWTPMLLKIREKLSLQVPEKYNICVVQRYPSGKYGIKPHRDKEMKRGTTIAGISVGETRKLRLSHSRSGVVHEFDLPAGSLYLLKSPTNEYWTHSIEEDSSKDPRISLTFRNYYN